MKAGVAASLAAAAVAAWLVVEGADRASPGEGVTRPSDEPERLLVSPATGAVASPAEPPPRKLVETGDAEPAGGMSAAVARKGDVEGWEHRITVRDVELLPVEGALIEGWSSTDDPHARGVVTAETDEHGQARLVTPDHVVMLSVRKEGVGSSGFQEIWRGLLRVWPEVALSGTVFDERGRPAPGAIVRAADQEGNQPGGRTYHPLPVVADAYGRFELIAWPGFMGELVAEWNGKASVPVHAWVSDDGEVMHVQPLELRVPGLYGIEGIVVGPTASKLSQAVVTAKLMSWRGPGVFESAESTLRRDGRFEIALAWSGEYAVTVAVPGWSQSAPVFVIVDDDRRMASVHLEPSRAWSIAGRVTTDTGLPVVDAWVEVRPVTGEGEAWVDAVLPADGEVLWDWDGLHDDEIAKTFERLGKLSSWRELTRKASTGGDGGFEVDGLAEGRAYDVIVRDSSSGGFGRRSKNRREHEAGTVRAGFGFLDIVVSDWIPDDELVERMWELDDASDG